MMAWKSGSPTSSCLEWSRWFAETKSAGWQLCYFLPCDISVGWCVPVLLFPELQEPALTSPAQHWVTARTAGAAVGHGMAWRYRTSQHWQPDWLVRQRPVCLSKVGMPPPPVALHTGLKSFSSQRPPLHFDFSAAFEGSGYILPPRLALSTPQRVNFIALRHDMMQRAGVTREVRVSGEHEREHE